MSGKLQLERRPQTLRFRSLMRAEPGRSLLPEEFRRFPPGLSAIDRLLDDPVGRSS
jgi:hypothetical protein